MNGPPHEKTGPHDEAGHPTTTTNSDPSISRATDRNCPTCGQSADLGRIIAVPQGGAR